MYHKMICCAASRIAPLITGCCNFLPLINIYLKLVEEERTGVTRAVDSKGR